MLYGCKQFRYRDYFSKYWQFYWKIRQHLKALGPLFFIDFIDFIDYHFPINLLKT